MTGKSRSLVFLISSFITSLVILLVALYHWQSLSWQMIQWQTALHRQMAVYMRQALDADLTTQAMLLGISFLYGIFHAAGPGHGKAILSTYLATHDSHLKRAMHISVGAALMQGLVAITLVTIITTLLGWTQRQAQQFGQSLDKYSFWLVALLGCYLAIRALIQLYTLVRHRPLKPTIQIKTIQSRTSHPQQKLFVHHHSVNPTMACSCGHAHAPDAQQLNQTDNWKTHLFMMLSMGIRPCTGALLVLVLAKSMNLYGLGISAVLLMSLGTAITVCLLAWFSHHMRQVTLRLLRHKADHTRWYAYTQTIVACIGGILLMMIGIGMAQSLAVQVSPFFRPG